MAAPSDNGTAALISRKEIAFLCRTILQSTPAGHAGRQVAEQELGIALAQLPDDEQRNAQVALSELEVASLIRKLCGIAERDEDASHAFEDRTSGDARAPSSRNPSLEERLQVLTEVFERVKREGYQKVLGVDPATPHGMAELGGLAAAFAMLKIGVEKSQGCDPAGIFAHEVTTSLLLFEGADRTNWLEGFCDQVQRYVEAFMEGRDIADVDPHLRT